MWFFNRPRLIAVCKEVRVLLGPLRGAEELSLCTTLPTISIKYAALEWVGYHLCSVDIIDVLY